MPSASTAAAYSRTSSMQLPLAWPSTSAGSRMRCDWPGANEIVVLMYVSL